MGLGEYPISFQIKRMVGFFSPSRKEFIFDSMRKFQPRAQIKNPIISVGRGTARSESYPKIAFNAMRKARFDGAPYRPAAGG
jgi:hypothetical protein